MKTTLKFLFVALLFSLASQASALPASMQKNPATKSLNKTIECKVGGCSGEVCVSSKESEGLMSICLWKEEFQCYKTAKCEVQKDGKCGWKRTKSLSNCLEKNKTNYK